MAKQPKSVRQQAKKAKELQNALNQPPEEPGLEEEPKPQDTAAPDKGEPKQDDKNSDSQVASPSEGAEPPKAQDGNWEARFKGLKDLHDREMPILRGQLKESQDLNEIQSRQIEELKAKLEAKPNEDPPAPAPVQVELTDEEREQLGPEMANLMSKIAQQSNAELVKTIVSLQKEISDLKDGQQNIQKNVEETSADRFYNELDRLVREATGKNWKDINKDAEFLAYLAQVVPETGLERQQHLVDAHKAQNAEQAAKFFIGFNSFINGQGGEQPSPHEDSPSENEVPEDLIQPPTKGGDIPPAKEERYYTADEVNQFYQDKRQGKYKGKETEAREIEKDILAAGQEGRIVNRRKHATA